MFATVTKRVPFLAKGVWNPINNQVNETVIKPRTNANSALFEDALKGKQFLIGDELTAADSKSDSVGCLQPLIIMHIRD